eukprot:5590733-Prymnesium_polylepis.1
MGGKTLLICGGSYALNTMAPSEVKFCPLSDTSSGSTDATCAGAIHESVDGVPLRFAGTV